MRQTSILLISLLFSLTATGQVINVKNVVELTLPTGAKKLTWEQRVEKNKVKTEMDLTLEVSEVYEIDNILIRMNAARGEMNKSEINGRLEQKKLGMDEIYGWDESDKNYISAIKTYNGQQLLVIFYERENVCYYNFTSFSSDAALVGGLTCKLTDKTKATLILDNILESIKFKN